MSQEQLANAKRGHPPAVLVVSHGITYGASYWDFPHKPDRYSAVNHMVGAGYATLNIDRIGAGRSGHPVSPLVTNDTNAATIHQMIEGLRAGKIGGMRFPHVGLVGHSYGSAVVWLESAMYNDADFVIATGYGNREKPVDATDLVARDEPALLNKRTGTQPWAIDPGYLANRPGTRASSPLYNLPNVDKGVIDADDKLQQTWTVGETATFLQRTYDGTHKNIKIPTFIINGENDRLFCGANEDKCATDAKPADDPGTVEKKSQNLQDYESAGLNSSACLRTASIPGMGHSVNLHRNAPQAFAQITYFADMAMGPQGQNNPKYRASCRTQPPNIADTLPELGRIPPPVSGLVP